jgi:outer membrane protein assembly factor BamB
MPVGTSGAYALSERALYLVQACTTYKLSRESGAVVWVHARGCTGGSHSTPVLDSGELYVDDGFNLVLNPSTGEAVRGFTARTGAALAGSRAFLVAGDGDLRAEDRKTGVVAWRFEGDGRLVSAPIVVNGVVYVASEDGTVFGVRQSSGKLVWQAETGAPVRPHGVITGLAASNGMLVVPTDGRLVAYAGP